MLQTNVKKAAVLTFTRNTSTSNAPGICYFKLNEDTESSKIVQ